MLNRLEPHWRDGKHGRVKAALTALRAYLASPCDETREQVACAEAGACAAAWGDDLDGNKPLPEADIPMPSLARCVEVSCMCVTGDPGNRPDSLVWIIGLASYQAWECYCQFMRERVSLWALGYAKPDFSEWL